MQTPAVTRALSLIDQLIPILNEAERALSSARTWGVFDMLGGGLFVDLVKHHKINRAKNAMDEASDLLSALQRELSGIQVPADSRMEVGGFLTFADFFFDGFLVDAFMFSKILSSLDHVRTLKDRIYRLRGYLQRM